MFITSSSYDSDVQVQCDTFADKIDDDNLDLLDFPICNLGNVDLSNNSFFAHEIFPDLFVEGHGSKQNKDLKCGNKYVIHRDFSQVEDDQALMEVNNGIIEKQSSTSLNVEKFPMKLHKIVERCEIDGYSDIISWMPHGRSFKIHKRNEFISEIMPRYFYITKFTSFIRQLTLYGFYKYRKGVDKGSFYHQLFLRGRQGLCLGINRSSEKKRKMESEPNFYKMQYLPRNDSLQKYDNAEDAPDRPRIVQYQTAGGGKYLSLPKSNITEGSSSFEYFHKSQQTMIKNLFSYHYDDGMNNDSQIIEDNFGCKAIFSCAA